MQKLITALLVLCLGAILVATPSRQGPPQTIDGALTPEAIPDRVGISIFFRLLAHFSEEDAKAYIEFKELGYPEVILGLVNEFRDEIKELDEEAGRIKDEDWPDPPESSMVRLHALQVKREALLYRLWAQLPAQASQYVLGMKSKIRLSRAGTRCRSDLLGGELTMKTWKVLNATLVIFLLVTSVSVIPQQSHDEDGSYISSYSDIWFDGNSLRGESVSEEDYDNFGHFLSITSTLSGPGGTSTAMAGGKFSVVAGPSLGVGSLTDGSYIVSGEHSWTCPYVLAIARI